jgi:hypothetical protein
MKTHMRAPFYLILGFLPVSASALKIAPVTGNVSVPGGSASASAGAAGNVAGAQNGLTSLGNTITGVGQTTLINIANPQVQIDADGAPAVAEVQALSAQGAFAAGAVPGAAGHTKASSRFASSSKGPGAPGDPSGANPSAETGVRSLDSTMKDLSAAKTREKKGQGGAVSSRLDSLFDFSKKRKGGGFEAPTDNKQGVAAKTDSAVSLNGLPDPAVVGSDKAVAKLSALAKNAAAAQAPFLYQRAVDIARDAKKSEMAGEVLASAAKQANASVNEAGNKAFIAAAKGRTTDALNYTKSVYGWNELLSANDRPLIANFSEFRDAVKHVLSEALDSPGKTLPTPTVTFKKEKGASGAQMKAYVSMPEGIRNQIAALPARFVADLALPDTLVSMEEFSAPEIGAPLNDQFNIGPQAGPGAVFRAQRKSGRSFLTSFWMAARRFFSSVSEGLWAWLRSFLQSIGVFSSAAGLRVDASSMESLQALPSQTVVSESARASASDAHRLGYKLFTETR